MDPREKATQAGAVANEIKERLQERVIEKFHSTEEFLKKTEFGQKFSRLLERTKRTFQGKRAFQAKLILEQEYRKGIR
jgi:DNA-binding transcriptional regulator PaaX